MTERILSISVATLIWRHWFCQRTKAMEAEYDLLAWSETAESRFPLLLLESCKPFQHIVKVNAVPATYPDAIPKMICLVFLQCKQFDFEPLLFMRRNRRVVHYPSATKYLIGAISTFMSFAGPIICTLLLL